jgi:transcriptional regulator with XRE-family HTH domain
MGLTQAELAQKLKMARNSVARMESGRMIITPPMALLISFVAREAGVDVASDSGTGSGASTGKAQSHQRVGHSGRADRKGAGSSSVSGRRR